MSPQTYTGMHTHTYTYTHIYTHTYKPIFTHILIHEPTHTQTHTHTDAHIRVHAQVRTEMVVEKGLDPIVADKIGTFVLQSGAPKVLWETLMSNKTFGDHAGKLNHNYFLFHVILSLVFPYYLISSEQNYCVINCL